MGYIGERRYHPMERFTLHVSERTVRDMLRLRLLPLDRAVTDADILRALDHLNRVEDGTHNAQA